jgi:tRNA dimethylallyltransferase
MISLMEIKNQMKNKFLLIILGPTATGKTNIAIRTAKLFNTEIISADSRQIYKELKIGTAVPDTSQLSRIQHHFIHHISIHDYYNVSIYEQEVLSLLDELFKKYHMIVMVGGSGLYIDTICHGIDDLPAVDTELRKKLLKKLGKEGIEALRFELKRIDPEYYSRVDLQNPKRILKALEVTYMTGVPYSSLLTGPKKERPFNIIKTGLHTVREELYARINARVDLMIDKGLVDEAKKLYPYRDINALKSVGYREIFEYFDGKRSLDETIEMIKRNTRHYARRQLTWFKKDPSIKWFRPDEFGQMIGYIKQKTGLNQ